MDELWQRYRQFWIPVLYGVGAFLAGLIVVHIASKDPDAGRSENLARARTIKNWSAPTEAQIREAKANTAALGKDVARWAARLDQRHGDAEDPVEAYVTQALRAAFLRGSAPGDAARFDGDRAAAAQAAAKYEQLLPARLDSLRNQDPNVSFSRLRADVLQELLLRANRADVDVSSGAEELGLSSVASVERADLPARLANLALVATIVDVAIREGVRSIDAVSLMPPEVRGRMQGPDAFLSEWPVKVDVTGSPAALGAVLAMLTDPERPTPLGTWTWKQAPRKEGLVRAEMKCYSVRVRPEARLGLETEGGE